MKRRSFLKQGPLKMGFMEVAKIPPEKIYTEEELSGTSKAFQKKFGGKKGQSTRTLSVNWQRNMQPGPKLSHHLVRFPRLEPVHRSYRMVMGGHMSLIKTK